MRTASRKRIFGAIASVACCALLPACSMTDALYTAGGSAVGAAPGAFVGSKASSNPAAPVIGAASGAAIGGIGTILAINSAKDGQRKQFQQGYDQGASDTVKRQYWILPKPSEGQTGARLPAHLLPVYHSARPERRGEDRPAQHRHPHLRMTAAPAGIARTL